MTACYEQAGDLPRMSVDFAIGGPELDALDFCTPAFSGHWKKAFSRISLSQGFSPRRALLSINALISTGVVRAFCAEMSVTMPAVPSERCPPSWHPGPVAELSVRRSAVVDLATRPGSARIRSLTTWFIKEAGLQPPFECGHGLPKSKLELQARASVSGAVQLCA